MLGLDTSTITTTAGKNNNKVIQSSLVIATPSGNLTDTLTGLDIGQGFGGLILLVNSHPTRNLVIQHNGSASDSVNRILTADGLNIVLPPFNTAIIGYDIVGSQWHVIKTAYTPTNYNSSGVIPINKKWYGLVSPSTGNGYSVDISSAGFTSVTSVMAIGIKNTATATSTPQVAVKSVSTTAVVLNITEASASVVTILGISVLSGPASIFANTSGLTVYVEVTGN